MDLCCILWITRFNLCGPFYGKWISFISSWKLQLDGLQTDLNRNLVVLSFFGRHVHVQLLRLAWDFWIFENCVFARQMFSGHLKNFSFVRQGQKTILRLTTLSLMHTTPWTRLGQILFSFWHDLGDEH